MPIGAALSKIFSSGASKLVDSIGTSLDNLITNKEELATAKTELQKVVNAHEVEMNKLLNDANADTEKELTDRLRIDMTSDNKLSKNIRPAVLIFLCVVITTLCILDSIPGIGFTIKPVWVELFKYAWMAVLSFYFIGREVQKWKQSDK